MPVEVMKAFDDKFGVNILEGYGLSETSPVARANSCCTLATSAKHGSPSTSTITSPQRSLAEAPAPSFGLLVLALAAGLGFGALNEVVEFIATLTMPETNVGGYINTGWDLVANTVGATTAVLLIGWFGRAGDSPSDAGGFEGEQ